VTTKAPRQRKTDRQRAEEALGVAQRKRDRLHKQARARRKELEAIDKELREAEQRLEYAKRDPALTQTPSTTSNQSGDTA
jgi:hypothetical protein